MTIETKIKIKRFLFWGILLSIPTFLVFTFHESLPDFLETPLRLISLPPSIIGMVIIEPFFNSSIAYIIILPLFSVLFYGGLTFFVSFLFDEDYNLGLRTLFGTIGGLLFLLLVIMSFDLMDWTNILL